MIVRVLYFQISDAVIYQNKALFMKKKYLFMLFSLFVSLRLQIYCIITAEDIFDCNNITDCELS